MNQFENMKGQNNNCECIAIIYRGGEIDMRNIILVRNIAINVSISRATNNGENKQEEVDNVQVQVQCREYIFLRGQRIFVFPAKHHLGVEYQVLKK